MLAEEETFAVHSLVSLFAFIYRKRKTCQQLNKEENIRSLIWLIRYVLMGGLAPARVSHHTYQTLSLRQTGITLYPSPGVLVWLINCYGYLNIRATVY